MLDSGQAVFTDARISANRLGGLYASGSGTQVTATRLWIDSTLSQESNKANGRGLAVLAGAQATLQEARLSANREVALDVSGKGSSLKGQWLLADGTLSRETKQDAGLGVSVQKAGQATLLDCRLTENRELGLFVQDAGSRLTATRLVVDGTLPRESDGLVGWGAAVKAGGGAVFAGERRVWGAANNRRLHGARGRTGMRVDPKWPSSHGVAKGHCGP